MLSSLTVDETWAYTSRFCHHILLAMMDCITGIVKPNKSLFCFVFRHAWRAIMLCALFSLHINWVFLLQSFLLFILSLFFSPSSPLSSPFLLLPLLHFSICPLTLPFYPLSPSSPPISFLPPPSPSFVLLTLLLSILLVTPLLPTILLFPPTCFYLFPSPPFPSPLLLTPSLSTSSSLRIPHPSWDVDWTRDERPSFKHSERMRGRYFLPRVSRTHRGRVWGS